MNVQSLDISNERIIYVVTASEFPIFFEEEEGIACFVMYISNCGDHADWQALYIPLRG
jgi:hypothetical protein